MMIPLAVKTIAAHEKSLMAVNFQNQPFYGFFDLAVILGVASELNVIAFFQIVLTASASVPPARFIFSGRASVTSPLNTCFPLAVLAILYISRRFRYSQP
jgi:hypothetical protein